jgi:hypothetical protein
MPNRITPNLDALVGDSITSLCPQGFHDFDSNHCAHFVSHVGGYRFGFLCHNMPDAEIATPSGVCVRVQELLPRCPQVGTWDHRPDTDDDLLVFITARANVNLTAKTIRNVPKKHIGIFRDGVYHSNTDEKVVRQTPEAVRRRFRGPGSDCRSLFGTLFMGPLAHAYAEDRRRARGIPRALSCTSVLTNSIPLTTANRARWPVAKTTRDMAALARKKGSSLSCALAYHRATAAAS